MNPIIVGWGHTPFGRLEGETLESMIHSVTREALAGAGVESSEVDGIWLGHFNSGLLPDAFASSIVVGADPGLRFTPAVRCENACASGSAAVYGALDAIASGRVKVALVVGAEKMSHLATPEVARALGGASCQREEAELTFPEIFARFAKRYGEKYGDPTEAMAHIAVKNHHNAMRNPLAQMHRELDLQFCLNVSNKNPMIADPLKISDCSLISDGAAALVIVSDELIDRFPRAVRFRAAQQVNDLLPMSAKDTTLFEGPRRAIEKAYAQAGITVDDLSLAEVHDCFTIAELQMTEALGVAKPGQGREVVIEGQTRRDGRLPVNVSGGLKAKGHPVGATGVSMHVLVARQLVGEAGDMQLPDPRLGVCVNMGGGAVATYASVLEAARA